VTSMCVSVKELTPQIVW